MIMTLFNLTKMMNSDRIGQVEQRSVVPEVDSDQAVLLRFNLVLKTMSVSWEHKAAAQLRKSCYKVM